MTSIMDRDDLKNKRECAQYLLNSVSDLCKKIDNKIAQLGRRTGTNSVMVDVDLPLSDAHEMTFLQSKLSNLKTIFSHLSGMVKRQDEFVDDIERNLEKGNENTSQGSESLSETASWISTKRWLLAKIGIGVSAAVVGILCFI